MRERIVFRSGVPACWAQVVAVARKHNRNRSAEICLLHCIADSLGGPYYQRVRSNRLARRGPEKSEFDVTLDSGVSTRPALGIQRELFGEFFHLPADLLQRSRVGAMI